MSDTSLTASEMRSLANLLDKIEEIGHGASEGEDAYVLVNSIIVQVNGRDGHVVLAWDEGGSFALNSVGTVDP